MQPFSVPPLPEDAEWREGMRCFLVEVIPRGIGLFDMPSGVPRKRANNLQMLRETVHLGSSIFTSASVRLKPASVYHDRRKPIPLNDDMGKPLHPTLHILLSWRHRLAKRWVDQADLSEADTKEINEQLALELDGDLPPRPPAKLIRDLLHNGDTSLALSQGNHPNFLAADRLPPYDSIRCFKPYPWTPEIESSLHEFRYTMKNDHLPLGMLKAGLLNWWFYKHHGIQETSEQDTALSEGTSESDPYYGPDDGQQPVSLASFLVHFVVSLGRAVFCEEIVPHHPARFAPQCEKSDAKSLKYLYQDTQHIRASSIKQDLLLKILDADPPTHLGRLITADLIGSTNPSVDPACEFFKEYLKLHNTNESRPDAIRPFIEMIGDVTAQGAGRFCKPGVRYVALLHASARNDLNLRPVKQFDTATPHRDTLTELEGRLKVKVINLLPKNELPPGRRLGGNGLPPSQNSIDLAGQDRAVKEEELDNAARELQEIDLMVPDEPAPVRADRAGKRAPSVEVIDAPSGKRARHDNSAITTSHLHEREKTSLNTMEALQLTPAEAAQVHASFIQYEVLQGGQGQRSGGSDTRRPQSGEDAENPRVAAALDIMKAMNLGIADASRVHACFLQRQGTKQHEDRVGNGTP